MQVDLSRSIPAAWRILVTGAAGFIGHNLCRRLCAAGLEVHATSRNARQSAGNGPVWWLADMGDVADARRIFSDIKPDVIVHLAGSVGAGVGRDLVLPTYHSLATSTLNVLVLSSEFGCRRVILAGSLNEPVPSLEPSVPGSPYAAAKWVGSAYGRMFHALYGTPVVNLRPFMAYGPAQAREKLIPSVVVSLLRGEAPRLTSGRARGDWIYIEDVVGAFVGAMTAPGIEGKTFDLGTGTLVPIRALVETLLEVSGSALVPEFGAIPDRPMEQEIVADTERAFEQLGWRATTSLEDGLRKTVAWYQAHLMDEDTNI